MKFATDITAQKMKTAEDAGKIDAISRAQAVIEFTPKGDILHANENFLNALAISSRTFRANITRCSASKAM